jgi:hypothetical protein
LNGKLQNEQVISAGEFQTILSTNNLNNGLYLVEISNTDGVIRKKIQVIH